MKLPEDLQPISNHILFQFVDEIDRGNHNSFKEKTSWGFEIRGDTKRSMNEGRWGIIIGLGPDAEKDFFIGQKICIEPMKWTNLVDYNGVSFSRTDTDNILAVEE